MCESAVAGGGGGAREDGDEGGRDVRWRDSLDDIGRHWGTREREKEKERERETNE